MNSFEKPEPSLCDSCKMAHNVDGGSVGIGTVSGEYKSYRQRYCAKKNIAIHTKGFEECEYYSSVAKHKNSD